MPQKTNFWQSLYEGLASLKLTVVLFLTLAACSIFGTLMPQGITDEAIQRHYTPFLAWWIDTLDLNDLYHAGWFRLLLLLLCVNLVVCTLRRLPKTLRLIQRREDQVHPQMLLKLNSHQQLSSRLPWDQTGPRLTRIISEEFAPVKLLSNEATYSAIAEKGRWSRLMVYVAHLSVLLILLGALMGSLLGFKGFMNLAEGEASNEVALSRRDQAVVLPFQVRCDDFDVSFYDTGAPKEFRSDLTILEGGQEVLKRTIRVNDPLTYQGVTFYQASYGAILRQAEVEFQDTASGKIFKVTLPFRETVSLPGTQDRVQAIQYQQDFNRFGPAVGIALLREGQEPTGSWILVNAPTFHGNRIQNYQVRVNRAEQAHYTGLQVKRDPGVWVVWVGFTIMMVGIGLTFYTSHRKLWIWAEPAASAKDPVKIIVAGRASKNSLAFEQEFNRLCERLQDGLQSEEKKA